MTRRRTTMEWPTSSAGLTELFGLLEPGPATGSRALADPRALLRGLNGRARGLRTADRLEELLPAHAEVARGGELARVVRDAAFARLKATGAGGALNRWSRSRRAATPPVEPAYEQEFLSELLAGSALEPLGSRSFAELLRTGSALALASLAVELRPMPSTRFLLGTVEALGAAPTDGLVRLRRVARQPASDELRRCAQQNAALAAWRLGDLGLALELCEAATDGPGSSPAAWVDRLAFTVRGGREEPARIAAEGFQEHVGSNPEAYAEACRSTVHALALPGARPDAATARFALELASRLPESAGAFLLATFAREERR